MSNVQSVGTAKVNTPATLYFNGQNLTADVKVTLANCDNGQTSIVNVNQIRHQCTPRVAGAQAAGWKANASSELKNVGSINVLPDTVLPGSPTMSNVQSVGTAKVNTPATLYFNGQNLTADVKVTLANCDNGQTSVVNVNQIRHQCTPRVAGAQAAGWKANDASPLQTVGTINVEAVAPPPPTPPQISNAQAQGALKVSQTGVILFNGANLTNAVRVTLANCDNGQTSIVNVNQIRHQCTPRVAGAQAAGWKANDASPLQTVGTINVAK